MSAPEHGRGLSWFFLVPRLRVLVDGGPGGRAEPLGVALSMSMPALTSVDQIDVGVPGVVTLFMTMTMDRTMNTVLFVVTGLVVVTTTITSGMVTMPGVGTRSCR